jgi:hypothetical protein
MRTLLFLLTALTCEAQTFTGSGSFIGVTNPVAGLVAWYKFNANSGTIAIDSSGQGNTGTLAGSTLPVWTNGVNGGGLYFDGSASYCTSALAPPIADTASIAFWVYAGPTNANNNRIMECAANTDAIYCTSMSAGSGTFRFVRSSGNSIVSTATFSPGVWSHWCLVENPSSAVWYYNGSPNVTNTITAVGTVNTTILTLGKYVGGGFFWGGRLDDVRIYNRALTSTEVLQIYNAGAGIP